MKRKSFTTRERNDTGKGINKLGNVLKMGGGNRRGPRKGRDNVQRLFCDKKWLELAALTI